MSKIFLVFPNQLFKKLPIDKETRVVLIEFPPFYHDPKLAEPFHKKKILLLYASMLAYRQKMEKAGHDPILIDYETLKAAPYKNLCEKIKALAPSSIQCHDLVDSAIFQDLNAEATANGIKIEFLKNPGFLTPAEEWGKCFTKEGRFDFTEFYAAQRIRLDLLVLLEKPVGGKWKYPSNNRHHIPRSLFIPKPPEPNSNPCVHEAQKFVQKNFPGAFGDSSDFAYPVTHEEAEKHFEKFLEFRLSLFARYFKTLHSDHDYLFHSGISPFLNIGLLTPEYVVQKTLEASEEIEFPSNCLEFFFRQIIGWREFVKLAYENEEKQLKETNYWEFENTLPEGFLLGNTEIIPLNLMVRKLIRTGNALLNERLYIAGVFMFLCEINPDEVYRWFARSMVDSYDWSLTMNVYGISQFAAGPKFGEHPILCDSAEIKRISNYRDAHWCRILDGLFNRFLSKHFERPELYPKYKLACRNYKKIPDSLKQDYENIVNRFLSDLWKKPFP